MTESIFDVLRPVTSTKVVSQIAGGSPMKTCKRKPWKRHRRAKRLAIGQADFVRLASRMMELPGPAGAAVRMASEGIGWRLEAGGKAAEDWRQLSHAERLTILVDAARAMPVRMAADSNPWTEYRGPRGGKGWKHGGTGDIRYGGERPSAGETGGSGEETPSTIHGAAAKHTGETPHESMTQEHFQATLNDLLDNPQDHGMSDADADRLEHAVKAISGHLTAKTTPAQVSEWWKQMTPHAKLDLIDRLMAAGHANRKEFKSAFIKHHGEATNGILSGAGGEGDRGGLSAGEPMGSDAAGLSEGKPAGTSGRTGGKRGGRGAGARAGGRVASDQAEGDADAARDPIADGGRASVAGSLPGTELEQPDTAKVQAVLSQPPTPKEPTDLSAGNWRYQTRDFAGGGLKTKFRNNIAALEVARAMRVEGRDRATPAEQAVMSKYVGWGQFPALFNDYKAQHHYGEEEEQHRRAEAIQAEIDPDFKPKEWEAEQKELKALLSPQEWSDGRQSTLNAHFTHPDIVDAHWKMAQRLGYTGGRFLETSGGIGYYLGQMPAAMAAKTHSSAVELDSSTGEMLKSLYPAAAVAIQGFEKYQAPDNFYDLVASNVPFHKTGPFDVRYNKFNASLHDYFFLKSADLCKPGGMVMHITSTGTMDKPDEAVRKHLAETCDLVAAYRMPGGAHKENAGTEVVTDMVILRKRLPGEKPVHPTETPAEALPIAADKKELARQLQAAGSQLDYAKLVEPGFTGITTDSLGRLYHWKDGKRVPGPDWTKVTTVPDPDGGEPITVNAYFAEHPENILGRLDRSGTMYSGEEKGVSLMTPEELTERLGRKVIVDVDADSKKRRFVYEDTGEKVPNADIHKHGAVAFKKRMQAAIDRLPEGVFHPDTGSKAAFQPDVMPASGDVKDGAWTIQDGKLYRRQGGALIEETVKGDNLERIQGMLAIRDIGRDINRKERMSGEEPAAERAELNRLYDAYVEKFGYLRDVKNTRPMVGDPDSYFLEGLENWDSKEGKATKADMFTKRTAGHQEETTSVNNVSDGLQASLRKFGGVDVDHIAVLMGISAEDVAFQIVDQGIAFQDSQDGWKPADIYLSGNVRRKLILARAAAEVDPKFKPNVEALEKNQPEDVDRDYGDGQTGVVPKMGANWIPPTDIQDFAKELLDSRGFPVVVNYVPATATWQVAWATGKEGGRLARMHMNSAQARDLWGTSRADIVKCFDSALNGRSITVRGGMDRFTNPDGEEIEFPAVNEEGKDVVNKAATADANAKVQEIREKFKEWLWQDEDRTARLLRYYNDNINNVKDIHYNGQHQTFPGMNPNINLHPHIRDFVWQVVTTGSGLAAHEVGTGKSFAMIASAMELRRLGLAKKPCIACLKANIRQITDDCLRLYPGAKILSTAGNFTAKKRQEIMARMATGDYDIVLMTHDQLNKLKMSPEVETKYIQDEIAELEAARLAAYADDPKAGNKVVKRLESAKLALQKKLHTLLNTEVKDKAMGFEETGIDQIFVDESHNFKALNVVTRANRVKGIPTSASQRATNMLMRARWLQEQNGGRGVVFATGTPISNTMAELYNTQRYLQGNELRERGLEHFDAWCNTFGEITTKLEDTVAGMMKPATRLSAFTNVPELMHIVRRTMDVVRADDLTRINPKTGEKEQVIKRPERKDEAVVSPNNETMRGLMASLAGRAEALSHRQGPPQPGDDNMLVICTDGRKGAVDMRLLDDNAPDDPDSKTNQAVRKILEIHKANPGKSQILFSDVGVNPQKEKAAPKDTDGGGMTGGAIPEPGAKKPKQTDVDAEDEDDDLGKMVSGESFSEANLGAKGRFRLYDDIIDKLVKGGIPREQIADFSRLDGRDRIVAMEQMNSGNIRVALGSTQKLGTGCNVQKKVIAMHHLDVPWVPASVEQRDGRGWRHGNEAYDEGKPVQIYRYIAAGSLDRKFWDIISQKSHWQNQVLNNRQSNLRTMKDDDSEVLTAEQLKAIASDDPRQLERANLEEDVRTLRAGASRHEREQHRLTKAVEKLKTELPPMQAKVKTYDADIEHLKAKPDFEWVTPEIPEVKETSRYDYEKHGYVKTPAIPAIPPQTHAKRSDAEKAFDEHFAAAKARVDKMDDYNRRYGSDSEPIQIGEYKGLKVFYDPAAAITIGGGRNAEPTFLEGKSGERYSVAPSLQSVEYVARNIPKKREELQGFIQGGERQIATAEKNLGKTFAKQADLDKKAAELQKLNEEMNPPKPGAKKPEAATKPQSPAPKPQPAPVAPRPIPAPIPQEPASQFPTHHILSGNTFTHKDAIKRLGGRWDSARKVWKVQLASTPEGVKAQQEAFQRLKGVRVSDNAAVAMSLDYSDVYGDPVAGYDDPTIHFYDPDYVAGYE